MALSTEQLLILNTLMYMDPEAFPAIVDDQGNTVGDLIRAADPQAIDPAAQYDGFITGQEWLNILQATRRDPVLMNMSIAATHIDRAEGGGGGRSAVFLSPRTGDAVVVYKGTQSPEEWADNLAGSNLADTPQQRNALNWYRQVYQQLGLNRYRVTVTGHSKGGNKAKYVSILDSTVNRGVSFDGQGFSDLFIQKYGSLIRRRKRYLESHSAEYDFVNFLFHNVGSATFYTASPLEGGGLARNHAPSAMMHTTPEGAIRMVPAPNGQAAGIQALGRFTDLYFQSMTPRRRAGSYATVEALRAAAFGIGNVSGRKDLINVFLPLVSDPEYSDHLAYLLAFTIKYTQCHPTFIGQIRQLLDRFGLEDITRYILLVDGIINLHLDTPLGTITFDRIFHELSNGTQGISPGLLAILIGWTASRGIDLTPGQLRQLLAIVPKVHTYMDIIPMDGCAPGWYQASRENNNGLHRLSQSLEWIGSAMGGTSGNVPGTRLSRAGSRIRAAGQITGQISSILQTFQDPESDAPQSDSVIDE